MFRNADPDAPRRERSFVRFFHSLDLKAKLMVTVIPCLVIILMTTGYVTYRLSTDYMDIALERNVRIRDLAQANAVERFLDQCRRDLLMASRQPLDEAAMLKTLEDLRESGGIQYSEFAYLSPDGDDHILLVVNDGRTYSVPGSSINHIRPNPLLHLDRLPRLSPGEVHPSDILDMEYPFPTEQNANHRIAEKIIRFVTPYTAPGKTAPGFLSLAVRASELRNILSLYNSRQSPLWGYPRSDEVRFSFLFDNQGWILFQSGDMDHPEADLTTFLARSGYKGTLGRPDLACAFRPSTAHGDYWEMVAEGAEGRAGIAKLRDDGHNSAKVANYYLSWAPVRFKLSPDAPPIVYAGAAYVDRSQLAVTAGYKYLDVMLVITLGSILLLSLLVYAMSRLAMGPIFRLTRAVSGMQATGRLQRLELPKSGYETARLQAAINGMIDRMRDQMEQIRQKDETIEHVNLKERARLEGDLAMLEEVLQGDMPEIVGVGPRMALFKGDIAKAAQVDVDVLIMGETGTGKQLVAEAIHSHSRRADATFISLNCGALDENLLLDALFGHVKGAFSEAKSDRKGAFLEADGGTLFLDEIQSASAKVQQALLRAIAMRKIKPLGQDTEIDVNVRLICATNADLNEMIEEGLFREDLYYRLKVLAIQTPALREHPESIPALALHYLRQAEQLVNREGLSLSKGALRKMTGYHWPGNIRELINSITRAAVMAESDVIQADEIRLEIEGLSYVSPLDQSVSKDALPSTGEEPMLAEEDRETPDEPDYAAAEPKHREPAGRSAPAEQERSGTPQSQPELNRRQRRALPLIRKRGTITRGDYQDIVGGKLASRTAIYDLQDLVKKGVLIKEGRGPATKYVINPKARLLAG
ncbi:sigma 54-interacting transcriptional regulator [Paucidesulfovibrio longus]|uniref:sigma 54-interacting transcriptional regulator n=1 Tax=Paucidesulfovibrio longus TaxID=889 RepID=UPI0003B494A0|nr:sigma-54 dependent transcriptional regulator [Paucidesulfovibrio longus]